MKKTPISRLAFRRNGIKGQISMAHTSFQQILMHNSRLLSTEDISILHSCVVSLGGVLERWDKHFVKKNYKKIIGG